MTDNHGYDYGVDNNILKRRACHDILEIEQIRNGSRKKNGYIRVSSDARLRNSLTVEQEIAYDAIAMAYSIITEGLGQHATDYSSARGGQLSANLTFGGEEMAQYWAWRDICRERHASPSMAIYIIIEGKTLKQCDAHYSKAAGTAGKNLHKCLDFWPTRVEKERRVPPQDVGFFDKMRAKWGIH